VDKYENVIEMVVNHLQTYLMVPFDDPEVSHDTNLLETGFVDSYGLIELIQQLESTYGIEFSAEDMVTSDVVTARGISRIVAEKIEVAKKSDSTA
jgi:acyl carrier protein